MNFQNMQMSNNQNYSKRNFQNNYSNNNNFFGNQNQRIRKTPIIGTDTQGRPLYKKSGCVTGFDKNKKVFTRGWKATKTNGLTSFFCSSTKYSKEVVSEATKTPWLTGISVKVSNRKNFTESLHWGIMNIQNGKVICKELGIVLNPKAPNGGVVAYIGTKPR